MCLVPVSSNEARPHAKAGRVPTWSLYNTRWVADSCTNSLPKNEFSQDTHLPYRVSTWLLYNTHGSHTCAWPRQQSPAACPKTPILGPTRTHSPKVSLKTSLPQVPTRRVEYPHDPSIIPMVSHPCSWPHP